MDRSGISRWSGRVAVALSSGALALALAACGSDGTAEVSPRGECIVEAGEPIPVGCLPELVGKITGVVFAPDGRYAGRDPYWWWPDVLTLASEAYALLFNVEPVGIGVEVGLSEVTPMDVSDGKIDSPIPVYQWAETDADGVFEILAREAEQIDRCRLILSVGNERNGDLSRALVYANNVNIDPASEAVVRMVLARIHSTSLQLCDFSPEGLRLITEQAQEAASIAEGANVEEINDDAFELVSRNCDVLETFEAVTQVSFDPPIRRTPRGDCEAIL